MITFKDKLKNIIENGKPVRTKFLTSSEQAQLKNSVKDKSILKLEGGYPNSELKRANFYCDEDIMITCFKINYNKKYLELTHQNILGTLLSLSITKDSIGDIISEDGIFFIISELKDYIIKEFTSISNVKIELEEINGSNVKRQVKLEETTSYIDSLRLDLIVSRICKMSRKESIAYIEADFVKVNHFVVNKNTKLIVDNDILSIRKYGRFIILDTSKTSKKGKIIIKYGKFV